MHAFQLGEDDFGTTSPICIVFAGSDDLMSRIFAAEKNEAPIPVGSQFHHGAEGRLYWPHQGHSLRVPEKEANPS